MERTQVASMAFMAVMVLLPLVPAFLLFKFLPSAGEASGPLHGVTFKFGGAFAGYLAVFLSLLYIRPSDGDHYHTWTVVGTLSVQPTTGEAEPNLNDVFVRFVPPRLGVLNQGAFAWDIPVIETGGRLLFPDVQLDLRGYRGVTIPLRRDSAYGALVPGAEYDDKQRVIRLTQPVVLKSSKDGPAYSTATAEKPVSVVEVKP